MYCGAQPRAKIARVQSKAERVDMEVVLWVNSDLRPFQSGGLVFLRRK